MTWTDAFRGIPRYAGTGFAKGDLATILPRRRSIRSGAPGAGVSFTVGELRAIAERINAQSERIAALEGAGAPLDAGDLAEYEAQRAAAISVTKAGVLVEDLAADDGWSALYNHTGACITQDHTSAVRQTVLDEGWSVHRFAAEGFLYDWDTPDPEGNGPGPDDYQEFPATLAEFQRVWGARLRAQQPIGPEAYRDRLVAEQEPRIPEDPITGEPGAERTERSA